MTEEAVIDVQADFQSGETSVHMALNLSLRLGNRFPDGDLIHVTAEKLAVAPRISAKAYLLGRGAGGRRAGPEHDIFQKHRPGRETRR